MKTAQAQRTINVLAVGVGGQGIITLTHILSEVAFRAGYDSKQSEIHGLSQRGGSVSGQVRWGPKIHTPMIMDGEADFLIALEELEALRNVHRLRPNGLVLVNDFRILPATVTTGTAQYPRTSTPSFPPTAASAASRRPTLPRRWATCGCRTSSCLGAVAARGLAGADLAGGDPRDMSAEARREEHRGLRPRPRGRGVRSRWGSISRAGNFRDALHDSSGATGFASAVRDFGIGVARRFFLQPRRSRLGLAAVKPLSCRPL